MPVVKSNRSQIVLFSILTLVLTAATVWAGRAWVPEFLDPPTLALHAVGATGMTAYFGLLDVGKPKPGDTVVV